jgi:hypothetical protein
MFVRVKTKGPYRYLQIVENHREGKRTVPRVLGGLWPPSIGGHSQPYIALEKCGAGTLACSFKGTAEGGCSTL